MKLTFIGATRGVTGSMHILEVNGRRILLDCGMYQGHRKEANELNRSFPFDPTTLHAAVLSHAHIDHSGNIPQLVKHGFTGNIYATSATRDLCSLMLRDSAHIQTRDAEYLTKKNLKKGLPPVEPLYTDEDAVCSLKNFVGIEYEKTFTITDSVKVTFYDAGHILGSALAALDIQEDGRKIRLLTLYDLGREGNPLLRDPVAIDNADYVITESTYGGRDHEAYSNMAGLLADVVNEAVKSKGKIIVPAFSVGRTQTIVYLLHQLIDHGKIPSIPVFVDSPLSTNVTEVFRFHPECYDDDVLYPLMTTDDPFGFQRLTYIKNVEESKNLNGMPGPLMIISASGMCESGRILHHLRNNLGDRHNVVLIIGFQAEHTLGRRLAGGITPVRILGEMCDVRAKVITMDGFSAHADRTGLLRYFERANKHNTIKQVFVVHGELEQAEALQRGLKHIGMANVSVPERGDSVEL